MANWFITGISRGLGLALAKALLAEGHHVVGTVRTGLPQVGPSAGTLRVLTADMADGTSVEAAVHAAFRELGRIDVVVNNAGYGLLGAVETSTEDELRNLFEVDVFAPIRVARVALPYLRAQSSGHIINITSIAGRAPGPGIALYAAAKHAMEGFSISLAQEVAPLGIRVTAVAPGQFRTDFLADSSISISAKEDPAYGPSVGATLSALSQINQNQLGDPELAAAAILAMANAEIPPVRLLLGSDAAKRARARTDADTKDMDLWSDLTASTDFAS
ncbi:SDR family NAD(P)-dependent oxidoreductase [Paracoccus sp. MBLB3053]|uniref:SDR family NAD(P)-dependent oxidoreductase n=1 Tax=Paracoccus aurantius TaxID=3073814 RepID=A0ABU2HXC2_9RHOB|nr:SDR family NAD(P)-dependent oxidoreductase [Paracoccus sp. MBLB3053]MDS9469705.1 SDR family NAD(P)-dependent oxidoreductase [Paracoccus sp. MBLB3053]